jgi:cytidine deaminase
MDALRAVPVADLLPDTYVWSDHQVEVPAVPRTGVRPMPAVPDSRQAAED